MRSTWRQMIDTHLVFHPGEGVEYCTLTEDELDVAFDSGYGVTEGKPFTAWTQHRVLFPVCYDGREFVASVPRAPCDEATDHVGGG